MCVCVCVCLCGEGGGGHSEVVVHPVYKNISFPALFNHTFWVFLLLFYSRAAGSYSAKAVMLVDAVAVHGEWIMTTFL